MVEENNCYFVSSRGILKSCDIFCLQPNSSDYNIRNYNSQLQNNDNYKTIYICNTAIPNFINNQFYGIHTIKCVFRHNNFFYVVNQIYMHLLILLILYLWLELNTPRVF